MSQKKERRIKNDFIMPLRYADIFSDLTKEQAGELIQGIFLYEATLQNPKFSNGEIRIAFKCIKKDLDFNREKYAAKVAANSENGRLGGRPKKAAEPKKANGFQESEWFSAEPKKAVYDNDNDNDKDITTNDSCSEQQTAVATEPPADSAEIEYSAEECEEAILPHGEKAERESSDTGEISVPEELKGLPLYMADDKLCKRWPELIAAWKVSYPGVNIHAEVSKAHAWEVANPKKRKVDRPRFLNTWLAKEQDRGGKVIGGRVKGQYEDGYKFKE